VDVTGDLVTQTRELRQRLSSAERSLEQLARERRAVTQLPREFRLCKTVSNGSEYPTDPDTNTFAIQFNDGEFSANEGEQAISWTPRSGEDLPHTFARSVRGEYIAEGTYCLAYHVRGPKQTGDAGEWWIDPAFEIRLGKADEDITTGSSGVVSWYLGETGTEEDTLINFTCKNKFALVPQGAWVQFVRIDEAFYLLSRGGGNVYVDGTNIIRFRLTGNLPLGSNAMAVILTPDGAGGYNTGDAIYVYDWFNAGSPGMFSGRVGYEGFAVLRGEGAYDIVWMETPAKWVAFVLDDDIVESSPSVWSAPATVSYYSHGRIMSEFIEVYAANETFRYCKEFGGGIALYNDQIDRYEIIRCEQMAVDATATLKYKMCQAVSTQDDANQEPPYWKIENFTAFGEGENILFPSPSPDKVSNPFAHKGKAGAKVLLRYGLPGHADKWCVVDAEKVEIDTLVSVAAEGCTLSRATVKIAAEICNDPGASEPYGTVGNPFSFNQHKTECVSGVLTQYQRTVDVDPCLTSGSVTYGEWSVVGTGGCCECGPADCCDFTEGDTVCLQTSSPEASLHGISETLTYLAGSGFNGESENIAQTITLDCTEGVGWFLQLHDAAVGFDENEHYFNFDCDTRSGVVTLDFDNEIDPPTPVTFTISACV
jgi:hypothetical protein